MHGGTVPEGREKAGCQIWFRLQGMNPVILFQGAAVPGGRVALPQKQKGVPCGLRRVDDTVPRCEMLTLFICCWPISILIQVPPRGWSDGYIHALEEPGTSRDSSCAWRSSPPRQHVPGRLPRRFVSTTWIMDPSRNPGIWGPAGGTRLCAFRALPLAGRQNQPVQCHGHL